MLVPFGVDVPMQRLPIANWLLIGVTVIISVTILMDPVAFEEPEDSDNEFERERLEHVPPEVAKAYRQIVHPPLPFLALQPKNFSFWQLATYVFVHGGYLHLIGNMIFLFCFGNAIDAKLGHGLFLLLYFVMAVVAGCAWLGF